MPTVPIVPQLRDLALNCVRALDDFVFERYGPARVLFVATDGYGFACQAPVIRCLRAYPGVRVCVTSDREHPHARFEFDSDDDRALFAELAIDARTAELAKWHIVVYSHMCGFYPRRRALRAYMHHGPGFGSGGGTHAAETCELYFGLSGAERQYLEERAPGLYGARRAFFPVGFPKSDALVNQAGTPSAARARLDLPERSSILIVSSRNPSCLLPVLGAAPFRAIAAAFPDWNVIQTGHPWLWQTRPDVDAAWQAGLVESLRAVEREYPNARFIPNLSADVLVLAADLLVADGTSVVTSFGLLDRPIVYFDNPARTEQSKRQWEPYRDAAHAFTRADEVVDACRAAIAAPEARREGRRRLREMFYANAGRAAPVMADLLHRIGRVCSTRSSHWPRVLALSAGALRPAAGA